MEILYISLENFNKFIGHLSETCDVFVPVKFSVPEAKQEKEYLHFEKYNPAIFEKIVIGEIRPSEPIKSFLNYSREKIDEIHKKKQVLIGVKSCDLNSLAIQDFVFKNNEPQDPFYAQKRQDTYIISSDCDLLYKNCFCTAAENKPYPEKEFDLNISSSLNGYLVEVGSDKGKNLIANHEALFVKNPEKKQIDQRDKKRGEFTAQLTEQVHNQGVPKFEFLKDKVKQKFASEIWKNFTETCIECGACNLACPTCHCFFISDQKKGNLNARYRSWDACLYKRFAVVAGGANPRRHLEERLRNRFEKKFDFFPTVLGINACTGCGRCFEACPGEIDIREILKNLVK